jgi:Adenylate and Guanylate cyclase catalytic domain
MVKFASSCRQQFNSLVSELVTQLGPDTRDLMLRIGLHSGPVTAGVLRGQKSRFQLFGDTVNTASRMESTGTPQKIHTTQETAKLLIDAGKGHWLVPRDTLVKAKGKGTIQTYWVEPTTKGPSTETSHPNSNQNDTEQPGTINWTADILVSLTKQVVAHLRSHGIAEPSNGASLKKHIDTVIDEFEEVIEMPPCSSETGQLYASVELSESVKKEIHGFVTAVSAAYRGKLHEAGLLAQPLRQVPHILVRLTGRQRIS